MEKIVRIRDISKNEIREILKQRGIRLLHEYKGYKSSHKFKCSDGHVWSALFFNVFRNDSGCPKCWSERRCLSSLEISLRLKEKGFILLGDYKGLGERVLIRCLRCSHEYRVTPMSPLSDRGCPNCYYESKFTPRVSIEEISRRLSKTRVRLLSKEWLGYMEPHKYRCLDCDYVWIASTIGARLPSCRSCSARNKNGILNLIQLKSKLRLINPKVKILGKFFDRSIHIKCLCLICKNTWAPTPATLLQGFGCPHCAIEKSKTTPEEIERLIKDKFPSTRIIEINGSFIKLTCLKCENLRTITRQQLSSNTSGRCLRCYPHRFGHSEESARKIIESLIGWRFPKAPPSKVPWLHGLHLDGYNKKHKIAFEYQGQQHYVYPNHFHKTKKAFLKYKRDDMRKRVQCLRKGVLLICIPYWKQNVKGFIKKKLIAAGCF